ncbi:MAG: sorbosone dehydrogenase family protein [Methylococcaceae bacterium]|nr:sorbosone dehydrogenase family protein [Methylococcaceae bacterium]
MSLTKYCRILLIASLAACAARAETDPAAGIRLPPGFQIQAFSAETPNARSLALGEDGTVYVGTMQEGKVYALRDHDGDGKAERVSVIASGLTMPNGVAVLDGDLYVADLSRLIRFKGLGARLTDPPPAETISADFPKEVHHGWKYLRAGPDHLLYLGIGAPCNVCRSQDPIYATLIRFDPTTKTREIVAHGVRNTVGFDWQPQTGILWFADNGRDWLGDDLPPDELNRAPRPGLHFGYPYCHGKDIADPEFGKGISCTDYVPPAWTFGPHVAPLGMRFYSGSQFPGEFRGRLFVAQHGSWNRTVPVGYRVVTVSFEQGEPSTETVFAEGWLKPNGEVKGRPVDILQMPDGALLVSDDKAGVIYRISHGAPR